MNYKKNGSYHTSIFAPPLVFRGGCEKSCCLGLASRAPHFQVQRAVKRREWRNTREPTGTSQHKLQPKRNETMALACWRKRTLSSSVSGLCHKLCGAKHVAPQRRSFAGSPPVIPWREAKTPNAQALRRKRRQTWPRWRARGRSRSWQRGRSTSQPLARRRRTSPS